MMRRNQEIRRLVGHGDPLISSKVLQELVEPYLGLASETVVDPGQHDDHFVLDVRKLRDNTGEVGRLAALYIADDQTLCVPGRTIRSRRMRNDGARRAVD